MIEYINGKLLINSKLIKANFLIKEGQFFLQYPKSNYKTVDLNKKIISPGFFDIHVHTREPGFSYKDDLIHVQESAMAGGVTQFVAMANTEPSPSSLESHTNIQKMMNKSFLKIYQASRVTFNNKLVDFKSISKKTNLFSDDGIPISNDLLMKKALLEAKKYDSILILHENEDSISGYAYHSSFANKYKIKSFDHHYESNIIKRDIKLNKKINAKIHIQHISTKEGVALFLKAKKEGMNISAELTPHHLCINNTQIHGDDTNYKMNPPLGGVEDQNALLNAFKLGKINIIATDHAPHSTKDKKGGFNNAAFGVINLETAFASIFTLLGEDYLSQILMAYSINPAKLIGIELGIKNNQKANIVIIDPDYEWTFTKKYIKSKSCNSPFINNKFKGKVIKTIFGKEERNFI